MLRSMVVVVELLGSWAKDNYVRKWVDLKRSQRPIGQRLTCVTRVVTQIWVSRCRRGRGRLYQQTKEPRTKGETADVPAVT